MCRQHVLSADQLEASLDVYIWTGNGKAAQMLQTLFATGGVLGAREVEAI